MQSSELSTLTEFVSALLTPIIAAVVAYIAYQQWRTDHRREKRESRASQLAVYRRAKALLRHVDYTREVDKELYSDFCDASAEADFLFPKGVREWLGEIESAAAQWLDCNQSISSATPDADGASIIRLERDMERLIDTLQNAHCVLREKFEAHMK